MVFGLTGCTVCMFSSELSNLGFLSDKLLVM